MMYRFEITFVERNPGGFAESRQKTLIASRFLVDQLVASGLFQTLKNHRLFVGDSGREADRIGFFERFDCPTERLFILGRHSIFVIVAESAGPAERDVIPFVGHPIDFRIGIVDAGMLRLVIHMACRTTVGTGCGNFGQFPCIARILEIGAHQRSHRADGDTLAAVGTLQRFAVGRTDKGLVELVPHGVGIFGHFVFQLFVEWLTAPWNRLERRVTDHILTDRHTSLTYDT